MKSIQEIRARRVAAEISAIALATKSKVDPTRLCRLERGYFQPTEDELERLRSALEQLICMRNTLQQAAAALGWPGAQVA